MKVIYIFLAFIISSALRSQIIIEDSESNRNEIQKLLDEKIISDTLAFNEGKKEALAYSKLAIRSIGDPGHVSSCQYYSYEKYGVSLEMTGDIIIDASIYDRNKGFNNVMKNRIKDSIPQFADSVGLISNKWIDFDNDIMNEFLTFLDFEITSDTTVIASIVKEKVKESLFVSLEGIEITDPITNILYDYKSLLKGSLFKIKGSNIYKGYMSLNFSNCISESLICTNRIIIPFRLSMD